MKSVKSWSTELTATTRASASSWASSNPPDFVFAITRDAGHLFIQATGQPRFEIFPEAQRQYFLKIVDAVITFDPDVNGQAPSLTLHQSSRDTIAKRIE
jgi:serine-type D-Ala-D-Ala carboxypeptidase/endopeptidase